MKVPLRGCGYEELLALATEDQTHCTIIASINFEERSVRFLDDLLDRARDRGLARTQLLPFRLVSQRSNPWSALELVKDQFQRSLDRKAKSGGFRLTVSEIEYPYDRGVAVSLLSQAQAQRPEGDGVLVMDISALPHRLATFLLREALAEAGGRPRWRFSQLLVVDTPPKEVTSRRGLGPFTVGIPQCVDHRELLRQPLVQRRTTTLVFPGGEGFEAKAVVDALQGHSADITVAFPGPCAAFPDAFDQLIANQALLSDASRDRLGLRYYFSDVDALRVMQEVVDRAARQCADHPDHAHALLVAPFGPKWAVALAAVAFRELERTLRARNVVTDVVTDLIVLDSFQYVSLFSRGTRTPTVYEVAS